MFLSQPLQMHSVSRRYPVSICFTGTFAQSAPNTANSSVFLPVLTENRRNSLKYRLRSAMLFYILPLLRRGKREERSVGKRRLSRVKENRLMKTKEEVRSVLPARGAGSSGMSADRLRRTKERSTGGCGDHSGLSVEHHTV